MSDATPPPPPAEGPRPADAPTSTAVDGATRPAEGTQRVLRGVPEVPARNGDGQGGDWQTRVVDTIEDAVGAVHDRFIRPVLVVARAAVFGVLIGIMTVIVMVLLSVTLIRLLDVYAFPGRVWASYALVGALFVVVGFVAWLQRQPRHAGET